jgi:hypothetical protein
MKDFDIKKKKSIQLFKGDKAQDDDTFKEESIQLYFDLMNGKLNYCYSLQLENHENVDNNIKSPESFQITSVGQNINLLIYKSNYSFGKEQKINLILTINDLKESKKYPINITIGEIIGNVNSTKIFYIKGVENKEEEILEIKAEKMRKDIHNLTIHFNLKIVSNKQMDEITNEIIEKNLIAEKNKLYFAIEQDNKRLYESESFTDDGKFNIVQIPLNIIKEKFSILFFNWKNKQICCINKSIKELTDINNSGQIIFTKQITLTEKLVIYNYSSIRDQITFFDYINKGIRIGLDIGIDFTGSNGPPDEPDSLHYWGENNQLNPYERAIMSCGKILANYDYDQLFPVYGFGAIIKGQRKASMCFNINFQDDPNIKYVENIIKNYHNCFDKIYLSGPTHFAPIINKIIEEIKRIDDVYEYHVLMILTDGMIEDMEETIDALVEGSFYPLSVIIVGIGNKDDDFEKMKKLDGDEIPIISRKGIKRQRDLVQFVPFSKFEGDETKLSQEVLDEIPRQIIEFYTLNFIYPDSINNNKKSIKEMGNKFKNISQELINPLFNPKSSLGIFSKNQPKESIA